MARKNIFDLYNEQNKTTESTPNESFVTRKEVEAETVTREETETVKETETSKTEEPNAEKVTETENESGVNENEL